jgi:hypothetical protein
MFDRTSPISPSDLSGHGPASRELGLRSRIPHRTCLTLDRLPEARDRFPEASHRTCPVPTRLVRWTSQVWSRLPSRGFHRTSTVKTLTNCSFEVGTINNPPPPRIVGHSENQKNSLRSKVWAPPPLSLRSKLWFLFLREDSSSLECTTDWSKSTSPSPSMTSLCLLLLGIQSPRRLGVAQEQARIVVESPEVCIALPFVGIDSEN